MKEQDIVKACAELDGLKIHLLSTGFVNNEVTYNWFIDKTVDRCPDYLTSYDAILSVIKKQPFGIRVKTGEILIEVTGMDVLTTKRLLIDALWQVTVPELYQALLRASGKWIDEL
jgi:hypothetical protein